MCGYTYDEYGIINANLCTYIFGLLLLLKYLNIFFAAFVFLPQKICAYNQQIVKVFVVPSKLFVMITTYCQFFFLELNQPSRYEFSAES